MALWPINLPQRTLRNGFKVSPGINAIMSENDRGPVSLRRRSSTAPRKVSATFGMSSAELAIFESFFENDLAMGSEEYQWLDPITQVNYYWVIDQGGSLPYSITNVGGDYYYLTLNIIRKDAV